MKAFYILFATLFINFSCFSQEDNYRKSTDQNQTQDEYLDEGEYLEEDTYREQEQEYKGEDQTPRVVIYNQETDKNIDKEWELDVRNVLKVNFFGLFGNSFTGEYERVINKKFSAQIAIGYRRINLDWLIADVTAVDYIDFYQSGITVVPELKIYWTHFSNTLRTPTGSYIGPFVRIGHYDMEFIDDYYQEYSVTYNLTTISAGAVMGFQVLANRVFAVDVFLGPQIKYKFVSNIRWEDPSNADNNVVQIDSPGVITGVRGGVTVGIAIE